VELEGEGKAEEAAAVAAAAEFVGEVVKDPDLPTL
jgi:hypothetical protein